MTERSENVALPTDEVALSPAYPLSYPLDGGGTAFTRGLTKREYIAAMAMQGIFAHGYTMPNESAEAALYAVRAADCLLKELAK